MKKDANCSSVYICMKGNKYLPAENKLTKSWGFFLIELNLYVLIWKDFQYK